VPRFEDYQNQEVNHARCQNLPNMWQW
jgi:hypothetical protein